MRLSKVQVVGLVLVATSISFNSLWANEMSDQEFNSPRVKRINVCKPAKILVESTRDELDSLTRENRLIQQINQLKQQISTKQADIASTERKLNKVRAQFNAQSNRYDRLKNHMAAEVQALKKQIQDKKKYVAKRRADIKHYQKKKDGCTGGLMGSLCRKKYRGRIKRAESDIRSAQSAQTSLQKKINSLPAERDRLPAQIKSSKKMVNQLRSKLNHLRNDAPTVAQLQAKRERLIAKNRRQQEEIETLENQLAEARLTLRKCRKMRTLSNAYGLAQRQVERFKQNPDLCKNIDSIIMYADKPFEKKAIVDAANAVCDLLTAPRQVVDNGRDDFDSFEEQPQGPELVIVKDEQVITTPTDPQTGEYKNNLRTADRKPIKLGTIGGSGNVKEIRFHVSYDIEAPGQSRMFDYLLIKDAMGNIVTKVAGSGDDDIVVNSSRVEVFFYSDGRSAGRGVTIDDIELTIEQ